MRNCTRVAEFYIINQGFSGQVVHFAGDMMGIVLDSKVTLENCQQWVFTVHMPLKKVSIS